MGVVGGTRTRLIRTSLFNKVNTGLTTLGWFDSNRQHVPIQFVQKEVPASESVEPNIIGLADGPSSDVDIEVGSTLSEQRLNYYIDVFAESTALGLHIAGDIKDIIQGRFTTTLGEYGPIVSVYDYRLATPTELFQVEVESVIIDRPEFASSRVPWKSHYYSIAVTLLDHYDTEDYQ
jgi:hypothetical protein